MATSKRWRFVRGPIHGSGSPSPFGRWSSSDQWDLYPFPPWRSLETVLALGKWRRGSSREQTKTLPGLEEPLANLSICTSLVIGWVGLTWFVKKCIYIYIFCVYIACKCKCFYVLICWEIGEGRIMKSSCVLLKTTKGEEADDYRWYLPLGFMAPVGYWAFLPHRNDRFSGCSCRLCFFCSTTFQRTLEKSLWVVLLMVQISCTTQHICK